MACEQYATAACNHEKACSRITTAEEALCNALEKSRCETNFLAAALANVESYDRLAMSACITGFSSLACRVRFERPAICESVSIVKAMPGQTCSWFRATNGCAVGTCESQGAGICPLCRAPLATGAGCVPNAVQPPCVSTAYCGTASDGGTSCLSKRADGQPCTLGFLQEETCTNGCFERADAGMRCGPLQLGEACADPSACGSDRFCAGLVRDCYIGCTLASKGVCTARIDVGQPCTNWREDDGCRAPGRCLGGVCQLAAPGTLRLGAPCDGVEQCADGLFCNGLATPPADGGAATGVCANRFFQSSACSLVAPLYDDPCTSGTRCVGGQCAALRGPTEPCQEAFDCRAYLDCFKPTGRDAGTCRQPADAGAACGTLDLVGDHNFGVSCATIANPRGFCLESPDAGALLSSGVCMPPRTIGASCTSGGQCDTQRCYQGFCAAVCM